MNAQSDNMRKSNVLLRVVRFYVDGFKSMTTGRILWFIILIKLFIIFVVLKIFFFPDFLSGKKTVQEKSDYVSGQLINRGQ